ncbi:hypothetical protein K469DRAFT_581072 [Zopfia rhizophila CBS 207.26]|uniref:non-specific serine/threonine protein kinase n=1 Tax=Zopfia rhizophila CBS 207.26 TaxID=1314779 RepID=A0A6A6DZQ9_9PEZI|nr:hypothetical protein K469DRAFT_581072 [Zopfia rhizophila CBS 207.26]
MEVKEELLSLDLEDSDYLYRIRRDDRIIYVSISPDLVPKSDRTNGPKVLSHLKRIPRWSDCWRTLTVEKTPNGILSEVDRFLPHSLAEHHISGQYYNLLNLTRIRRISDRVSLVSQNHRKCMLKIARFEHELEALSTEIRAYSILQAHHSTLAPTFLGYVYEEEENRVIGFLMEVLQGYHPHLRDQQLCKDAIQEFHEIGIVHGDPNKYNILVEGDTAKFIDFEEATFWDDYDFGKSIEEEGHNLIRSLTDTSGLGNYGF